MTGQISPFDVDSKVLLPKHVRIPSKLNLANRRTTVPPPGQEGAELSRWTLRFSAFTMTTAAGRFSLRNTWTHLPADSEDP